MSDKAFRALSPADLCGQTLITYRVSTLAESLTLPDNAVVIVTRETDPQEIAALRGLCRKPGAALPLRSFGDLQANEAAIVPGARESGGRAKRFEVAPRLRPHVRHRTNCLDMPVPEAQAFVFSADGRWTARGRSRNSSG